jgi:hypothetical protein
MVQSMRCKGAVPVLLLGKEGEITNEDVYFIFIYRYP